MTGEGGGGSGRALLRCGGGRRGPRVGAAHTLAFDWKRAAAAAAAAASGSSWPTHADAANRSAQPIRMRSVVAGECTCYDSPVVFEHEEGHRFPSDRKFNAGLREHLREALLTTDA